MPLLPCEDCGTPVSDRAPACPKCGLPTRRARIAEAQSAAEEAKSASQALKEGRKLKREIDKFNRSNGSCLRSLVQLILAIIVAVVMVNMLKSGCDGKKAPAVEIPEPVNSPPVAVIPAGPAPIPAADPFAVAPVPALAKPSEPTELPDPAAAKAAKDEAEKVSIKDRAIRERQKMIDDKRAKRARVK